MAQFKPSRRARTGRNTVSCRVVTDVGALVQGLRADVQEATRPAAQEMADVLYRAVLTNVAALGKGTGNLRSAIYQAFSEDKSQAAGGGYSRATYHVSWNARKAPHGHLVEYGHIQKFKAYVGKDGKWYTNKNAPLATPKQVAARPFIRPAYHRQDEAIAAAKAKFLELLGAK